MYKEDNRVYFSDHDWDVLEQATFDEAKHRLQNDRMLLWESIGPDALPNDIEESKRIESAIAAALADDDYAELGRLVSNMALEYAFKCCHAQIVDDWQNYLEEVG